MAPGGNADAPAAGRAATGEVESDCDRADNQGGRDKQKPPAPGAQFRDISAEMLRYANDHEATDPRGIGYVEGSVHDLAAFADASFDGVLCHMAFMDIPEISPTIRSVGRVTRGGGWFVFSIVHPAYHPHVEILCDYLLDHRYRKQARVDWLPEHAYHRPLATYVNELTQAGFGIERLVEEH